jgi:ribosomal protein S18 acetylase RimI-like enzyme
MKLRKAILSDFDEILIMKRQSHKFHYQNRPDFYKNTDTVITKEEFENMLNSHDDEIYVVDCDKKICGYAFVKIIKFKENQIIQDHERFFIDDIFVDKNIRNKGIGQFIMSELETECKLKGIKYIDLTVWSFNENAFQFYKNNSMKEIIYRMEKRIE